MPAAVRDGRVSRDTEPLQPCLAAALLLGLPGTKGFGVHSAAS